MRSTYLEREGKVLAAPLLCLSAIAFGDQRPVLCAYSFQGWATIDNAHGLA
jgi:hypothetical protein